MRILEMQTTAQLTLRKARELLLPLREEARRHNAVTRGAALALSAIRKKGLDAVPQASLPLFTRPQSTFRHRQPVEAYVYALARFEPKPAQFPRAAASARASSRAHRAARGDDRALPAGTAAAGPDGRLLEQEPEGATDELLYWFSRLSRDSRFQRNRLERREYLTREHRVSLSSFALVANAND